MITTVFILGVVNLCLGFLLAAYAEQASERLVALLATSHVAALPVQPPLPNDVELDATVPTVNEPAAQPQPFDPTSLPRDWRRMLDDNRIKPRSTLEGLLWTLKLELLMLRGQLVHLENQATNADNNTKVLDRWQTNHQEWTVRLNEFAKVLASVKEQSRHAEIEASLQDLLLDHQFDAQQTTTSLKLMSDSRGQDTDAAGACSSGIVGKQLAEQIGDFHLIRDRVDELLVTFLRENGRLGDIDDLLQIEGVSEIYNRVGFEVIFQQWRDADPNGEQPVCCLLVDIDRFSQKNEQFGNDIGDIIIAAFGGLLKSLLRIERGFDRVARFDGRAYALFLGNTKLDDAISVAERTRQCIEATSFNVGDESFDVTTSLGLVEFDPTLEMGAYYKMLREAVASAKSAGRNRTCTLRGNHPEIASTSSIQVKGRVIEIAAKRSPAG